MVSPLFCLYLFCRGIFSSICSGDRLEAAMQRLTNLCSVLNDMEPICVLNHVFVLREVSAPIRFKYNFWISVLLFLGKSYES